MAKRSKRDAKTRPKDRNRQWNLFLTNTTIISFQNISLQVHQFTTRGSMKVMLPIFVSAIIITITTKFTYIMEPAFTKLRVFSTKPSSLATHFFPFAWDAICWSSRNLYWSIRSLRTCCVSAHCHPQNVVAGVHLWKARKEEVRGY